MTAAHRSLWLNVVAGLTLGAWAAHVSAQQPATPRATRPPAPGATQRPPQSQPAATNAPRTAATPPAKTNQPAAAEPGVDAARQPRPTGEALRLEALPPELEALLAAWERESAKIKKLDGKHYRWEYNSVFQVEKRSQGVFYFEAPDKGRLDMKAIQPDKNARSSRTGSDGTPYTLQAGADQRWICTGKEIFAIDDAAKTFEIFHIPQEDQGANIIQSPLPFLFGLKAADAKRRFDFLSYRIDPASKTRGETVTLEIRPRLQRDAQNYSRATVILDGKRFVPLAVRLLDNAGTIETTYKFEDININSSGIGARLAELFKGDPFAPSLAGYRAVMPDKAQIEQTGGRTPTGKNGVPVQPAGQRSLGGGIPGGGTPAGAGNRPTSSGAAPSTLPRTKN